MWKMGKKTRLLHLLLQIIVLLLLLYFLESNGEPLIFGASIALTFGVAVISIFSSIVSFLLPERRHRILRDTQFSVSVYLGKLAFILTTMMLFVNGAEGSNNEMIQNQKLFDILSMGFLMLAAFSPIAHIGYVLSTIKSVEYRNPKEIIRQYYKRPKTR